MTTLREAAAQALEALGLWATGRDMDAVALNDLIAGLEAALADGDSLSPTEPVAWYHVPHPGNGISPVVSMFQQHEPSLYAVAVPLFIREQL